MSSFLGAMRARGFLHETTDDAALENLFGEAEAAGRAVPAYIGFDPSASSLHVGSLVQIMALVHLQRAGHRPIALVGGGTGRVGDPSGKSELRKVLSEDSIEENLRGLRRQIGRFVDLVDDPAAASGSTGFLVDNGDWLLGIRYIDFLRDVGRHFSINRMLTAESVKLRLESESGLSFLEFNYSLLQAYDFLVLNQRYGCRVQIGGKDQWGNIVAGIDLTRRVEGAAVFGMTTPLITTSSGKKMGKTEQGAVWLDADRTSPYDYYQFWVNVEDADVGRFLRLFTLLPLDEIESLEALEGADIRQAKERLAVEATAINHGREEAERAREAARALFSKSGAGSASVPTRDLPRRDLEAGIPAVQLFVDVGLCDSKGAARRLARQGGLYLREEKLAEDRALGVDDLDGSSLLLRVGKKKYLRVEAV